jgi:hypothetical protein
MEIIPLLLALAVPVLAGEPPKINYDESKVGAVVLPDLLRTAHGETITTARQWEKQRRPEVWQLFQEHVYGRMPPRPADLRFVVTATKPDALGGKATRKFIHISLANHPEWKGIDLMLHVPNGVRGKVPVFVGLSFGGNYTVVAEPDVPVHQRWARTETGKAGEGQRGRSASSWQLEMILDRGFALATAYYGDIEPDHANGWKDGVRAALSKDGAATVWKDGDWAAIGAWSWGLSRILDYLETDSSVDATRAAVIGHSRLGKTALWTGASDPRFALVIANNSGEGGASLMRRDYGETTQSITKNFPHWFTPTYRSYANRANDCPIDQHMLVALIAPRPVYIASAVDDKWADPKGEFLSGKFAEPVYSLYEKKGLGVEEHPAVDQPVGDVIGYHVRTGKHDVTEYDWRQYLAFAARHFGVAAGAPAATLPIAVSSDGRHLIDKTGAPFLLHGDTAWSLLVMLDQEETERYLEDRRQRGFNALIVNLLEHKFATNPPNNRNGDGPFLTPGDFSTPNEAYFRHADWVIRKAEEKGILVFLFPCYWGYAGGDEGFWKELNANGAAKCREYGRYVGARYRGFTNIVWIHGADYSPPTDSPGMGYGLEILHGIQEKDASKLNSFHGVRSTTALDHVRFAPFLQLNSVYTGDELSKTGKATVADPYLVALRAYNRTDFKPTFLIEARYENLTGSSYGGLHSKERHRVRRQPYWVVLSGATGHFFGNSPVWGFRPGWDGPIGIGSPGNQDMAHVRQVFTSVAWHTLVPDQDHSAVTAGYGTFGQADYVTAARGRDGGLLVAYVPPTGTGPRTLTVAMSRLSGKVRARWFNPVSGSYSEIAGSPFANSGSMDFSTPGDNGTGMNDWVLILEAKPNSRS